MRRGVVLRFAVAVAIVAASVLLASCGLTGQQAGQPQPFSILQKHSRIVDDTDRVPTESTVHPLAANAHPLAPVARNQRLEKMVLVLKRPPEAEAELASLLAQQHDPDSPLYHRWLTPAEFGSRFGISDEDLKSVTQWLQTHGFTIDEVAQGRGWINFSGSVEQVETAFQTRINRFVVEGKLHYANTSVPTIPRGLADIVHGPLSLHNFHKRPASRARPFAAAAKAPEFTNGSSHYLAPADFSTIYDVQPLYSSGLDGSGQSIAIVGRSDIKLSDVQYFRSYFGLPANDPVVIYNGTNPGFWDASEELEADLDVQWAGAVARGATILFVTSKSTFTTDGVDLSAQYIVDHNLAPIMSTSFGACEQELQSSGVNFYKNLWMQAASQGITSLVSSGDTGTAGCSTPRVSLGVSGLCSTPYNVCVGGTQFSDTLSPDLYWSPLSDPADKSSARSYLPEQAWNESGIINGVPQLWATGGGTSIVHPRPSWQIAPNMPANAWRNVPDVSLAAASHDGYLVFQGHTSTRLGLMVVGGTSASTPSFAGLMALVLQKTGSPQGNANTVLYPMAQNQYLANGPAVFHDITSGNNAVPGFTGYQAVGGYDRATGLGSVDANEMVNNWGVPVIPAFSLRIFSGPSLLTISRRPPQAVALQVVPVNGFNATVHLACAGLPRGVQCQFSPASDLLVSATTNASLTFTAAHLAPPGVYRVTVLARSAGFPLRSQTVLLTVR